MITTKNNFKGYLRRKYPNIVATPVYGLPLYILDKPLSEVDNFSYNIQPLPNGKYVAFIGISIQEATRLLEQINKEGIPSASRTHEKETAPTTFSCFEAWLDRHQFSFINRTFCNDMSPRDCFHSDNILGCTSPLHKGTWYMYELPAYIDDGKRFVNIPHIIIDDGTGRGDILIVLIKASASRYKSKKQRFIEHFQLMQPIYEKLIVACATAVANETKESGSGTVEWEQAKALCEQYMNIQFQTTGVVDIEEMKEAYRNGTIGLFTRDISKLYTEDSETF